METEKAPTILRLVSPTRYPENYHLTIMFCALAFLQLVAEWTLNEYLLLVKPFPMLLLILTASRNTPAQNSIFLGLVFSTIGDICLMIKSVGMFQVGTLSFLIAHLLYIRGFALDICWASLLKIRGNRCILMALTVVFVISMVTYNMIDLWDKTPNRTLFALYGVMLCSMGISAVLRRDDRMGNSSCYWRLIVGALLFEISDNTLAAVKFNGVETPLNSVFIMLTYYSAQFFIMIGMNWTTIPN